jgi:hypothetical protein
MSLRFLTLRPTKFSIIMVAGLGFSLIRCGDSSAPKSTSSRSGGSLSGKPSGSRRQGGDAQGTSKDPQGNTCTDGICDVTIDDSPATGDHTKEPSSWCTLASATRVAGQELAEHLNTICKDGAPTQFMLSTLVPNAYAGSGEPQLYAVQPVDVSNKQVSAFFAVAIKMTITAAQHYERIAAWDGKVETEKAKIEAEGGTPANDVSVTPVAALSDKDWTRGWTINSSSSFKTKGFPSTTIKIRYNYQLDHYKFDNAGYMYASTIKQGLDTVKNFQMLDAALDIDGSGHQIVLVKISADDKGQAAKVRDAVKGLASNLVKFLYQQSTR